MTAEALISRLEKPRATGRGTWICRCPAHEDKNPSMTVRELDDGRVLVHCFAQCATEDILAAMGLEFDALFPPKPIGYAAPIRRPFPVADVLEALAHEALVVQMTAGAIVRGEELTAERIARLRKASERIQAGRDLANG